MPACFLSFYNFSFLLFFFFLFFFFLFCFSQAARDKKLPDKLITSIQQNISASGQADCILMLLCKVKPFIWSMQKALNDRLTGENEINKQTPKNDESITPDKIAVFFQYLPSLEEFTKNGVECENHYPNCKLF
jgi:hypothetical protein